LSPQKGEQEGNATNL